ncbi:MULTISPECIES: AI-2E family transporter [unclassified Meridianimarinicoccus]|uniref:AI-2E family transporter n=1 Tax=unclassified Meridianimarinicoccus TaxID=2923344 RepID=UPI0018662B29|nr:AI-2E family transporter [Fluviibacterium sp. MJW13]
MTPSNRPPERPGPERLAIDLTIRIGLLILFIGVIAALVHPFVTVMIWAVILTVTLYPVYLWIRDRLVRSGIVAAGIVTVLSLALILGPIGLLSASLIESMLAIAEAVRDRKIDLTTLPDALTDLPTVGPEIEKFWTLATDNTGDFLKHYGHTMLAPSEWLLKVVVGLAGSTLVFAIAIVASGFLFVPAPRLVAALHDIRMRIVGPKGTDFVTLAAATIRSVSRGIVGVSVLQALAFGCVALVMGIPHAGLLTAILLVLTIVQIGSGIVIYPVLAWVWFTRDFSAALVFALAMSPIFVLENLLKPIALSSGVTTPTLVVAVGVFGGLIAFGLPGLFIGPVALAVFFELVVFWVWPDRIPAAEAEASDE